MSVYTLIMAPRIITDPAICNGCSVVKGTPITVQTILEFLGAGNSIDDILQEYPTLTPDDVLAARSEAR